MPSRLDQLLLLLRPPRQVDSSRAVVVDEPVRHGHYLTQTGLRLVAIIALAMVSNKGVSVPGGADKVPGSEVIDGAVVTEEVVVSSVGVQAPGVVELQALPGMLQQERWTLEIRQARHDLSAKPLLLQTGTE